MKDKPVNEMSLQELITLGEILAESGFFSDCQSSQQATTKLLAGKELGFGALASMTGIYILKGRITLSANLIASAVRRSGAYDYRINRLDNRGCEIEFLELQQPEGKWVSLGVSTFTMEDAERAGLARNDNWQRYPRNMCFARAMSNGAKWHCPDIFGGPVYTPEELEIETDEDGNPVRPIPAPRPPAAAAQPKTDIGPQGEARQDQQPTAPATVQAPSAEQRWANMLGIVRAQVETGKRPEHKRADIQKQAEALWKTNVRELGMLYPIYRVERENQPPASNQALMLELLNEYGISVIKVETVAVCRQALEALAAAWEKQQPENQPRPAGPQQYETVTHDINELYQQTLDAQDAQAQAAQAQGVPAQPAPQDQPAQAQPQQQLGMGFDERDSESNTEEG